MQAIESKLGGGEGIEGIYGSITATGMQKVFDCMQNSCGLDTTSALVDIGAGLGRPLLHAALRYGLSGAYGVELDPVKCRKAEAFIPHVIRELGARGVACHGAMATPLITRAPVERLQSLEPATHAYSFWEGVPRDGKAAFGRLFRESQTLKAVAVVQRSMRLADPCEEMTELGFGPLQLVSSFSVNMSGSGRSFMAYVFSKAAAHTEPGPACGDEPSAGSGDECDAPEANAASAAPRSPPPSAPLHALDCESAAPLVKLRTSQDARPPGGPHLFEGWRGERCAGRADVGRSPAGACKRGLAEAPGTGSGSRKDGTEAAGQLAEGGSPAKKTREHGGDGCAATGAEEGGSEWSEAAADSRRGEIDQRGAGPDAGAPGPSHSYSLRPKRLEWSRSLSNSSGGSGAAAGRAPGGGAAALRRSASEGSRSGPAGGAGGRSGTSGGRGGTDQRPRRAATLPTPAAAAPRPSGHASARAKALPAAPDCVPGDSSGCSELAETLALGRGGSSSAVGGEQAGVAAREQQSAPSGAASCSTKTQAADGGGGRTRQPAISSLFRQRKGRPAGAAGKGKDEQAARQQGPAAGFGLMGAAR